MSSTALHRLKRIACEEGMVLEIPGQAECGGPWQELKSDLECPRHAAAYMQTHGPMSMRTGA